MDINPRDMIDVLLLKAIDNYRFRVGSISKITMGSRLLARIIRSRGQNQYNMIPLEYNRYMGIDVVKNDSVKGFRLS